MRRRSISNEFQYRIRISEQIQSRWFNFSNIWISLKRIYNNINNNNYLPLPHPSVLINHPWLGKTMSRLNNRKFPYPNLSQRVKFTFWGARWFVRSFVLSSISLLLLLSFFRFCQNHNYDPCMTCLNFQLLFRR